MSVNLKEQVLEYMGQCCRPARGKPLLIGCSGGPDSLTLAHLMFQLRDELQIEPVVAHLDHRLRPGSHGDAQRVQKYAERWGVAVEVETVDVGALAAQHGESLEMAGRRARYAFFARLADRHDTDQLALGHQRHDQVETVLLNLIRGAGRRGLSGMKPEDRWPMGLERGRVLRPLLAVDRAQIAAYLEDHGLEPSHDATNQDPAFLRNRVRHQLIPLIKEGFNEGIEDHLWQLAQLIREEEDLLAGVAGGWLDRHAEQGPHAIALPLDPLQQAHLALRRRLYRLAYERLTAGSEVLTFQHVEDLDTVVQTGETGQRIHLPGDLMARRGYDDLFLETRRAVRDPQAYDMTLDVPGQCSLPGGAWALLTAHVLADPGVEGSNVAGHETFEESEPGWTAYLDLNRVRAAAGNGSLQLRVRSRRPGDRFQPLGMQGHKKLKDFLIDAKVPAALRDELPLITAGSTIVCVVGHRIAEPYRVDCHTEQVLVLRARPRGGEALV